MTNIVIETAVQRARAIALSGAPDQFDEALEAVVTLDRGGEAPLRELRMLSVVAAARRADLTAVDAALRSVGALAPSDWKSLHQWLLAAPEMRHDAYAAFVRDLDRRMRRSTKRSPARRLTAALAVLLVASCLSLLVLAWRLSAHDPADQTQMAISGVLDGQPSTVLAAIPGAWADQLRGATRQLSQVPPDQLKAEREATTAAMQALAKSLQQAASGANAATVAARWIGANATTAQLQQLAAGFKAMQDSPWLDVNRWHGEGWSWSPDAAGQFAWRTLVRHAPLGVWMPGLFGADWQCDARTSPTVFVHATARNGPTATLLVQLGAKSWHTPMVRIGRDWASAAIAERWPTWQPSLEPAACTPDMARWLQASIAQTANALAAWTDRMAAGQDAPAPPVQDIGWWVP
jgi:hypothetical protein